MSQDEIDGRTRAAINAYLASGQDYAGFSRLMNATDDIHDERLDNIVNSADMAMYEGVDWQLIRSGLRRSLVALLESLPDEWEDDEVLMPRAEQAIADLSKHLDMLESSLASNGLAIAEIQRSHRRWLWAIPLAALLMAVPIVAALVVLAVLP